ncbi:MAG: hypothetical protein JO171_03330 [Paludibacterium sp.]|uniref:hypothetical protein n=1 Tax=Paludibacterium sp. TaxID=1917523 RepID=UPI0025E5B7AC|nr:hypothetical protein [Paludibacterium sp.]MBV8046157.1 hypothetical protein [Paludibacterium sp.]MBV8648777.1 hypothetical protein [Paludibacterium sp.]
MIDSIQKASTANSIAAVSAAGAKDDSFSTLYQAQQQTSAAQSNETASGGAPPYALFSAALLPTPENIEKLRQQAEGLLTQQMGAAGLSTAPAFDINEDLATGRMTISGNRPDKDKIEALINGNNTLRMALHNASALASQLPAMQAGAQYAQAWQQAGTDEQRNAVYNYFRSLFDSLPGQTHTQLSMGPSGLGLTLNGQVISSTSS